MCVSTKTDVKTDDAVYALSLLMFHFGEFIHSFVQCRLMTKLKGEEYIDSLLSKEDCERRQQELASGMMVVHNYSKGLCHLSTCTYSRSVSQ